jgi:predicted nucleotidyltransferase
MIETLISSKTRIKLLLKFFLNSSTTSYLRNLESEFGDSTNSIRLELNRLEEAGMLTSFLQGNKKFFRANTDHPLFGEVHNILLKYIGFDKIIENIIERLGDVEKVYVSGAFARGLDSQIIDLVFIGDVNKNFLIELIDKVEILIKRKLRYVVFDSEEEHEINWSSLDFKPLLLWTNE